MKAQAAFAFKEERPAPKASQFPATRYQGSKLKLLDWIWLQLEPLRFKSVVDVFGGTGSVAYLFKTQGKAVHYNDVLRANWHVGQALIENGTERLLPADVDSVLKKDPDRKYDDFIARTFSGVFFTDEENAQLDVIVQNIAGIRSPEKRALAFYSVFQACIAKRPYNLFHRANLYMRTAEVERSFGNKATWDRSFRDHMMQYAQDASAAVFDNGQKNVATCQDAASLVVTENLAYLDPPYISGKGLGTDYLEFYHFLEGLSEYEEWESKIAMKYKHRPYKRANSPWVQATKIEAAFDEVFARCSKSVLAISYRSDGIPSVEDLVKMLKRHDRKVMVREVDYQYALSKNRESREVLLIAE